jgi:hypothetical protein
MPEVRGATEALMEMVRMRSAEHTLISSKELIPLLGEAGDPVAIMELGADEDIKMMRGSLDTYYFSDRSITESYAKHLFRLAERDPARLIAETTRDESKTYPRPTPVDTFTDAPFSMSAADIEAALAAMAADPQYKDIRRVEASNGDAYLYSSQHLTEAHAAGLAEWASVGEKENP